MFRGGPCVVTGLEPLGPAFAFCNGPRAWMGLGPLKSPGPGPIFLGGPREMTGLGPLEPVFKFRGGSFTLGGGASAMILNGMPGLADRLVSMFIF